MVLTAKSGRTYEYFAGVHLPVPDDFELPTCTRCGEELHDYEVMERLHEILLRGL